MKRRAALQRTALLMGGIISAPTLIALMSGCKSKPKTLSTINSFSSDEQLLISDLTEVIIPSTSTPGAKEAGVGAFIVMMLKDCYSTDQLKSFKEGLVDVNIESQKLGGDFVDLDKSKRDQVVRIMSDKAKTQVAQQNLSTTPFFTILKELTTFGYFSSEIGQTLALDFISIPGRYDSCIDIKPDQKAYSI